MIHYSRNTKQAAQELRKNMTPQEKHLWYDYLRTYPQQFRRQKQIDRFIVDFYCASARLVVEIDGSQHFSPEGIAYDAERTNTLARYGVRVILSPHEMRIACHCQNSFTASPVSCSAIILLTSRFQLWNPWLFTPLPVSGS